MNKRIKIWRDYNAECPFEAWDCEPPLIAEGARGYKRDYSEGGIHEFVQNKATDGKIIRYQKALAEILEIDLTYFKDQGFSKSDKISDIRYEIGRANLRQLAELCYLLNIKHLHHNSMGYSQGDWTSILIVLTDEYCERIGYNPKDEEDILKGTAKLYDDWAWGDVYGFTIEEKKKFTKTYEDGTTEEDEEWEEIDSCGGFYGDDWKTNGILDHVPEELHEQVLNYDYEGIEY